MNGQFLCGLCTKYSVPSTDYPVHHLCSGQERVSISIGHLTCPFFYSFDVFRAYGVHADWSLTNPYQKISFSLALVLKPFQPRIQAQNSNQPSKIIAESYSYFGAFAGKYVPSNYACLLFFFSFLTSKCFFFFFSFFILGIHQNHIVLRMPGGNERQSQ